MASNKRTVYLAVLIILMVGLWLFYPDSATNSKITPTWLEADSSGLVVELSDSLVPPVLYMKVPDLRSMSIPERKKVFINLLLPSILMVQDQIERERNRVEITLESSRISSEDTVYLNRLVKIYNVEAYSELAKHLIMPPVSIVISQAAIESGWGTSRFFREGNNIFGMWSYSKTDKRIQAKYMRGDKAVYVRKFDSLYDSILNYARTIGRHRAYREFRTAILNQEDPMDMVIHLHRYSERGEVYTQMLKQLIRKNNFLQYDHYVLLAEWEGSPV